MFVARALGWFFLAPFKYTYDLLKNYVVKIVVSLYRVWRLTKKTAVSHRYTQRLNADHQFLSIPSFIFILAILVLTFNIHSRQNPPELGSQSLLNRIFNQVEEFTVVESVLAQGDEVPTQLLAALETSPTIDGLNTISVDGENLQPVADANGALVRPNITSAAQIERGNVIEYIVQPGDNIGIISDAHGISSATILWANNLSAHSIIRPGEKLKILPVSGVMYIVKSGDTLSTIAQKYDVEISDIMEANEIVSEHQLQINQGLIIPGGAPLTTRTRTTQLANFGQIFSSSPAVQSNSGYIWPTTSRRITQYYWLRHKAIDVGGSPNITIVASRGGRVEYSGWSNGYGYNVLINHGDGVKTRYAHMRQLWVQTGQQVSQGEGLGKKGTTGHSTGVHLHFEIIVNGQAVNPLSYL